MEKPDKIINLNFNDKEYKIEVIGNIDKAESFIYYTFKFDEDNFIVISKFDGEKWKIASMAENSIAEKLGKIIDNLK